MRKSFLLAALAAALVTAPVAAQSKSKSGFGPVVGLNLPAGDFGDFYNTGWTAGLQHVKGTGFGSLMAEATFNGFSYQDDINDVSDIFDDNLEAWGFGLGPRFALGPLNVGALGSYHTDMDEFDVIPLATINVWKLDLGVRYKGLFGDFDWFGVTAAIHFGSW